MRASARRLRQSGATTIQILVLLVPVIFGFAGFAVDLGRLYMVRAELQTAANSIALASAGQLMGTEASQAAATTAAQTARSSSGGLQLKWDFGGIPVGETQGNFGSTVDEPAFFDSVEAATGTGDAAGGLGGTPRHVRIIVTADAPTVFWRFIPQAQEGRVQIRAQAVAGMSAPLCTACGIESIAVAALDATDDVNFGFTEATRYTLGYVCNGANQPQPLAGTTQRIPYILLNRWNEEATSFVEEQTQTYRIGAGGLPGSTVAARACVQVNAVETFWASAQPLQCQQNQVPTQVQGFMCGLTNRFETGIYSGCENIPEVDTASQGYLADADTTDIEDYASYAGNGRRVLTIAIVDQLTDLTALTVLGFRQFLLEPTANTTNITPLDTNGRFAALYLGSQMPLKQGRFSGCSITTGPGKVVLHQ